MSSYKGLSRAYRPQAFDNVIGQEAIVLTLKNALRRQKTAQAYLFCGTRGTGKTTLARVLSKALNCKNLSEDCEPCNKCSSCVEISQGKSLNVFEIDGASHRGIDDMRQLNESVIYAPTSSGCKIFIIDEAHMLTKEAFNALLKTLEEPPPNVKFFLATTEPHKVPPTILSRCQRFDLQRIPSSLIAQKLSLILKDASLSYEEEALYAIANLSDGSMRVAESLLDQILCFSTGPLTTSAVCSSLAILPSDPFFDFDTAFASYNLSVAFEWASSLFSSGKDLAHFLDCLMDHYRNILAIQLRLTTSEIHPSLLQRYQNSAKIYTQEQVLYILEYLLEWYQHSNKTPFKRVSIEMILLHLLRSKHRVSAVDLVCKLQEMQTSPMPIEIIREPTQEIQPKPEPLPLEKPLEAPPKKTTVELKPINAESSIPPKEKETTSLIEQAKQETLMRFASIELEGLLTKES
jgi:DNA polymerase-3 subunit gamma/tau